MESEKNYDIWLKEKLIAHRGFHSIIDSIPENSLIAFKRAVDFDFAIELDVHILKDGKIVVYHDYNLKRITGQNKIIDDCTYDEIKELKLYNTNYKIPLLTDVLEFINGRVPVLIEIKSQRKIGFLEENLCLALSSYKGKFALQSFDFHSIKWLKKNAPNITRGQLIGNLSDLKKYMDLLVNKILFNEINAPRFVACFLDYVPNWVVKKRNRQEIYLIGWTIRSFEQYRKALKLFDNIIFEGFNPNG